MKIKHRNNEITLLLMILISLCSQIFALYKSSYTATHFGTTDAMDAYNYSTNIANFLFAFVTTGVTTVIIPAYIKKKNPRAVNTFITVTYLAVITIMILIYIFRIPLISLLSNREMEFARYFGDFLIFSFIIQGIISFLAVTTAFYQCRDKYLIPKSIVLISNFVVVSVLVISKELTIYEYIQVLLLGSVINFAVDILIAVKLGFRYYPAFDIAIPETKDLFLIFLPTLFSSGVYKIHTLVDSMIAANLGTGQLTILTYATQIVNMVNMFIVGNLTVYAYPKIVKQIQKTDGKERLWDYSILFHSIVCLIIVGVITVGDNFINMVFVGGSFSQDSAKILFISAAIYILGQQTNIVRDLIYRYFYANDDTKTTFYNSVIVSFLNIILSLILVNFLGLYGIIIGTILASCVSLIMILIRFSKKFGLGNTFKNTLLEYGKTIIITFSTITLLLLIKKNICFTNQIVNFIVFGVLTVIVYGCLMFIFRSKALKVRL